LSQGKGPVQPLPGDPLIYNQRAAALLARFFACLYKLGMTDREMGQHHSSGTHLWLEFKGVLAKRSC
jgi:hypothetical protein